MESEPREKVLSVNPHESIRVKWDGERFALIKKRNNGVLVEPTMVGGYGVSNNQSVQAIILSPREMVALIEFAGNLGGE